MVFPKLLNDCHAKTGLPVIGAVYLFLSLLFAQEPVASGSYMPQQDGPCLAPAAREAIRMQLQEQVEWLRRSGKIRPAAATAVRFQWPVRAAEAGRYFDIHGISNFLDQDPDYGDILDYECGDRTYDVSGYNHAGTDIFSWPFSWYQMDSDGVEVIAAADGIIIEKSDGHDDRSCEFSNDDWNAVYLMHADGSVSWYGHMKKHSLTALGVGDSVRVGDFLGIMGSSGNSTGPHLHFEVYDASGDLADPYSGNCNSLNSDTLWAVQRPYEDSAINALLTHFAPPDFPPCPQTESPNLQDIFLPGEQVWFGAYYRDHLRNQVSEYSILRPDSTVFQSWSHSPNRRFQSASYYLWTYILPADAASGFWTFRVVFEGITYEHQFEVPVLTGINDADARVPSGYSLQQNYPNPFNPHTVIRYSLPRDALVKIAVFDAGGREVQTLVDGMVKQGAHEVSFLADELPSGIYFYRLSSDKLALTRRMVLLK